MPDTPEAAQPTEDRTRLAPRRAGPAFLVSTALYWMSLYLYLPVLAPYVEFKGGGLGIVGVVVSAYGLAQLLLRLPLGVASDRFGRRKPFLALGFVASSVACALSHLHRLCCSCRGPQRAGAAASQVPVALVRRAAPRATGYRRCCRQRWHSGG